MMLTELAEISVFIGMQTKKSCKQNGGTQNRNKRNVKNVPTRLRLLSEEKKLDTTYNS